MSTRKKTSESRKTSSKKLTHRPKEKKEKVVKKPSVKTLHRSSKTGKIVSKKFADTHKATTQKETVENGTYWSNRSETDTRKDWRNGGADWIEEYVLSSEHPHRNLIVNAVKGFSSFAGILEVGCNAGPNLYRLSQAFPETQLAGIDINEPAVARAQSYLQKAILKVGTATTIPFENESFDVGIVDAVFMYLSPDEMHQAASELQRVIRKGIVLVEWFDESPEGVVKDFHWARNYPELFAGYGFELVESTPLTKENWPHPTWQKNGKLFVLVVR